MLGTPMHAWYPHAAAISRSGCAQVLASYSNFRYFSEMLSSGAMDSEFATAMMDFRETHGGTLSGMTRYTDHLDDMPAVGYAISSLAEDRVERFLLLLHGHAANYQGRGSFLSDEYGNFDNIFGQLLARFRTTQHVPCDMVYLAPCLSDADWCLQSDAVSGSRGLFRQQSLYQSKTHPKWRDTLGDIQDSFCTPSQTLIASMTAMQVRYSPCAVSVCYDGVL